MKPLIVTGLKIVGAVFGLILIGFTGYETWTFLYNVTGNVLIAVLGLIMFEGGFLYWGATFAKGSEGLLQLALSFIASLLCLLGVVAAVGMQLGAIDPATIDPQLAPRIIVAMVIVNLLVKYFFTLSSPEQFRHIMAQAIEGVLLAKTYQAFQARADDIADATADAMANSWIQQATHQYQSRWTALSGQEQKQQKLLPPPAGGESVPPDELNRVWQQIVQERQAAQNGNGTGREPQVFNMTSTPVNVSTRPANTRYIVKYWENGREIVSSPMAEEAAWDRAKTLRQAGHGQVHMIPVDNSGRVIPAGQPIEQEPAPGNGGQPNRGEQALSPAAIRLITNNFTDPHERWASWSVGDLQGRLNPGIWEDGLSFPEEWDIKQELEIREKVLELDGQSDSALAHLMRDGDDRSSRIAAYRLLKARQEQQGK